MFSGSSIDAPQKDFPILDGRSAKIRQQLLAEGKEPQPHSFEALGLEAGGALKLLTKARHQPEEGRTRRLVCRIPQALFQLRA